MTIPASSPGHREVCHARATQPHGTIAETTPPRPGDDLPLVDPSVLQELEKHLDGPAIAQRFARDYAEMWEQRYRRLAVSLQGRDRAAALDAILSLKISSAMVGAIRLALTAEALEQIIRHGEFTDGQALVATVADHGSRTIKALRSTYITENE